jgi:general L-amino acid transport system substrate-binding protein
MVVNIFNIVKWSLNAMIGAEEFGINSNNVNAKFKNPEALRLLGRSGNLHKHLGNNSRRWVF